MGVYFHYISYAVVHDKSDKDLVCSWSTSVSSIYEPGHEKMCLMSYANIKGADQPAHPRSLIRAFIVRCLDSILSLDSIAEISRLYLASVAAQAGLCLAWSESLEDTFSRDEAHIYIYIALQKGGQLCFVRAFSQEDIK